LRPQDGNFCHLREEMTHVSKPMDAQHPAKASSGRAAQEFDASLAARHWREHYFTLLIYFK